MASTPPSKKKPWNEIKTHDSWSVFKVISEMVEGFEKLARIGPCVSIFGSARTDPHHSYYKKAERIASLLTEAGYGVISGGGPGIMEAANKGAQAYEGASVGLGITLPNEQEPNRFIDPDKLIMFNYFFIRKVMFMKYSQGFIVMPGGSGTLDELFEAFTLIQTQKINSFPLILVEKDYWSGLLDWLRGTVLGAQHISRRRPRDHSSRRHTRRSDRSDRELLQTQKRNTISQLLNQKCLPFTFLLEKHRPSKKQAQKSAQKARPLSQTLYLMPT